MGLVYLGSLRVVIQDYWWNWMMVSDAGAVRRSVPVDSLAMQKEWYILWIQTPGVVNVVDMILNIGYDLKWWKGKRWMNIFCLAAWYRKRQVVSMSDNLLFQEHGKNYSVVTIRYDIKYSGFLMPNYRYPASDDPVWERAKLLLVPAPTLRPSAWHP